MVQRHRVHTVNVAVGDEVFVQESANRTRRAEQARIHQGTVVKVGRVNITVRWGDTYTCESTFRIDNGWENTTHTRNYSADARRVFTPEGWADHQARREASDRIDIHRHRGVLHHGGLNDAATSDLIRLADLLDEIAHMKPRRGEGAS